MTWKAWGPDGRRVIQLDGKITPDALVDEESLRDDEKVSRQYRAGLKVQEVTMLTGLSISSIYRALRRTGTPLR